MFRKLLLKYLFLSVVFLFVFAYTAKTTFAVSCTIEMTAGSLSNELPSNFNGTVEIAPTSTQTNCFFPTSQEFVVAVYPTTKQPGNTGGSATLGDFVKTVGSISTEVPAFYTKPGMIVAATGQGIDCTIDGGKFCGKLQGRLDLTLKAGLLGGRPIKYVTGDEFPDQLWNIVVCTADRADQCTVGTNLFATGQFRVGAVSAPTAPPDLPEIDLTNQKCLFQSGVDSVTINVKKIDPKIGNIYRWWWDGDWNNYHTFLTTTGTETTASFVIPPTIPGKCDPNNQNSTDCTVNLDGTKRLCVDRGRLSRSQFSENCVNFRFQKSPIDAVTPTACDAKNRGSSTECTPDLIKACALSPDKKVCENGRCVRKTVSAEASCDIIRNNPGITTAIGCIHTNPVSFITDAFKFLVAISGGIAFLLMVLGAFQMITSQGNPQTLNGARERFTSALIGLLFVIFAVLLLQIIGTNILNLPGFGTT